MRQKIIKAGNSLAVTIPAKFCKDIGIKNGDTVEVKTRIETGQIIYQFFGTHQLILSQDLFRPKIK